MWNVTEPGGKRWIGCEGGDDLIQHIGKWREAEWNEILGELIKMVPRHIIPHYDGASEVFYLLPYFTLSFLKLSAQSSTEMW